MSARTLYRLRVILWVTIAAGLVGGIIGARLSGTVPAAIGGAATGAVDGFVLVVLEQVLRGPAASPLLRLPLPMVFGLRTVLYSAVFVLGTLAAAMLARATLPASPLSSLDILSGDNIAPFVGVSLAFNFAFTLRGLLGGRTLVALLTGRYHRPRLEERVVLFADLRGSTGLAERLGEARFLEFLNRLVHDLTDAVLESGGEIYRYVGDEVIVTWPRADRDCVRALLCVLAIEDALAQRRGDYLAAFAAAPQLRAALHVGPVMIGEIGDFKREIAILGNTMNTTARIEEVCRRSGRDFIASAAVMQRLPAVPRGIIVEPLGTMPLRGKQEMLDLVAVSRSDRDAG